MTERIVGVIQARLGSSRLPGKVLAPIGGRPLIAWTISAMRAVRSLDQLVVATTDTAEDDPLVRELDGVVAVHRGPVHDVLTRCWDAVALLDPTIVIRQTADNPFVDPDVVGAQVDRLIAGSFDFVGNAGWPLGIAGEVARASALGEAAREAVDPAEREHVMPFIYARPERYRIGTLDAPADPGHHRYTVDTERDLELARRLAAAVGHGPPVRLAELAAAMHAEPGLAELNADVRQKHWHEVDERAGSGQDT